MVFRVLLASVLSLACFSAQATPISPSSYTFTESTDCGTWCYHDPNFTKLTDGVVGNAGWAVNAGAEWNGWNNTGIVDITFFFDAPVLLNSVSIGSTQDNLWDVVLPSFIVRGYQNNIEVFSSSIDNPASSANDKDLTDTSAHGFFTASGIDTYADRVTVSALARGPWIFIDEVIFDGEAASVDVPESSAYMVFLLGLLSLVGARRLRRSV